MLNPIFLSIQGVASISMQRMTGNFQQPMMRSRVASIVVHNSVLPMQYNFTKKYIIQQC